MHVYMKIRAGSFFNDIKHTALQMTVTRTIYMLSVSEKSELVVIIAQG